MISRLEFITPGGRGATRAVLDSFCGPSYRSADGWGRSTEFELTPYVRRGRADREEEWSCGRDAAGPSGAAMGSRLRTPLGAVVLVEGQPVP